MDHDDNHLLWVYSSSHIARDERLQTLVLAGSATWVASAWLRRQTRRLGGENVPVSGDGDGNNVSSVKPPRRYHRYDFAIAVSLAGALACLHQVSSQDEIFAAPPRLPFLTVVYVLVLRFLGGSERCFRHVLLFQSNLVLWLSLSLLAVAELLPCIDATRPCAPRRPVVPAILCLLAAALCAAAAPRPRTPPPADMPARELYSQRDPAPEEVCSALAYHCTYGWIGPLVGKGNRGRVSEADIPTLPWYDEPLLLMREMAKARERGWSTFWTLVWFTRRETLSMAGYSITACLAENIAPFALYRLLRYLAHPAEATVRPWVWLAVMFVGGLAHSLLHHQHMFVGTRHLLHTECGFKLDLYQRAMSSMELDDDAFAGGGKGASNKKSAGPGRDESGGSSATATGRMANLMSADIVDVRGLGQCWHQACTVPVGIGISLLALHRLVGWIALVGTGVLVLGLPFSVYVAAKAQVLSVASKKIIDTRISVATEYLGAIRAVKYFAWEDVAVQKITEAREAEQRNQRALIWLHVWPGQLSQLVPYVALLAVFSLYVAVSGRSLDAATGFTAMYLLGNIKKHADAVGSTTNDVIKGRIACERLQRFFEGTVLKETYPAGPLCIRNATFRRSRTAAFALRDVSIDFVDGGLNVVAGPSGSGKTTLLLAILGETLREAGDVTRPDDVAFASQSPWLRNETVRDNVLFHAGFDRARYDAVLELCCLGPDLDELPDGDLSRVGENGATLSGGQRARVALARALYSRSPLLLLDDVFSALDAHTAARVWDRCFCGDFLGDRTTVLVTQIPWIAAHADLCVTLVDGSVGSVERRGGVVRRSDPDVALHFGAGSQSDDESRYSPQRHKEEQKRKAGDRRSQAPFDGILAKRGAATRLSFALKYLGKFGSRRFIAFCIAVMLLAKATPIVRSVWLSWWVEAHGDPAANLFNMQEAAGAGTSRGAAANVLTYLGIYALLSLLDSGFDTVSRTAFSIGSWNASRTLHNNFVRAVVHTSLSWYRTVPVGSVVSRLSGDMRVVDTSFAWLFTHLVRYAIDLLFRFGAVSSVLSAFVVPTGLACALGMWVGEVYTRTALALTRLAAASGAPVFSQFVDSLAGLAVIRARRGMPDAFAGELAASLREWSRAQQAHMACHRWVSVRLDLIAACVALFGGMIAVWKAGVVATGLVGLSLSSSTELSSNFIALIRAVNQLETEMSSVERIEEYAALDPEDKGDDPYPEEGDESASGLEKKYRHQAVIPKDWPARGEIEFRNATIRYDPEGPDILRDVNLKFAAGERVAIVGRTGAGKSTLILALLRFALVASGEILFDGIPIHLLPRRRLRESVTIIPQEATLLHGTVQYNLDPTGRIPVSRLRESLDFCRGIASFRQGAAHDRSSGPNPPDSQSRGIALDAPVLPRGENFSHGQRQVLSLCRALARGSRLMLLDEATASMDYETDRGVQDVLRARVAREDGATLVTIAHRLRTIVDYDSVAVVDGGRVVEFGPPKGLFRQRGAFYRMVCSSGERADLERLLA